MAPRFLTLALVGAALLTAMTGPAAASGDRDALSDETIGLMIDDSGPGQAEALLGVLYLRGMRIESDPVAASAWLDRAARAGHPAGIYGAARMHADGIGVPVDAERARRLLRDADPARFGPLADAVSRLRRDLGLSETPAVAVPEVDGRAIEPAAALPATDEGKTTPAVPATTEPATFTEPAAARPEPPPAEPVAAERPTAETPPAPPTGETANSPFAQLATLFSEASTASEMARIRGIVPAHLLQGRELGVRAVRLGDGRTAWRIVATGFAQRDDVRIFCGLVAASGLGCIPRG